MVRLCAYSCEECGGCRRSRDSDREHAFEVIQADGSILRMCASTSEESQCWLQALCQAVSQGMGVSLHALYQAVSRGMEKSQ